MKPRIAINGLGRIGRTILKIGLEKKANIIAINSLSDPSKIAYLLKYDSIYGAYDKKIIVGKNFIKIDNKKLLVFQEKEPENLPWKKLKIDVVVEATGVFCDKAGSRKHLTAGAKKVIISAPCELPDITIVPGVNDKKLKKEHKVISLASCTTNCLAPIVKILNDKFKIKRAMMTTIHAYTNDQSLQDSSHRKNRRGRAATENIIPTTTGASSSVETVLPELLGKIKGLAVRVPVICGSLVDLVAELKKNFTEQTINNEFKKLSKGKMKGILSYSEDELVSSDIIKNPHSAIVDGLSTQKDGNLVKVLVWYDNEYGYSMRMIDLINMLKF